ncbi:MAG: thioesterase [Bacteroidia bacterium]|nr:thioesterase [Bacteroidia bacterium]
MEKPAIWTDTYTVRASQADVHRRLRLPALCHAMQETAAHHAVEIGAGFDDMRALEKVWVLYKMRLVLTRTLCWQETFRVETWVRDLRGPYSSRDFYVRDGAGDIVVRASFLWVTLDWTSRKPVRIGDVGHLFPLLPERQALTDLPGKLPEVPLTGPCWSTIARYSDTDLAGHVNNAAYLRWMYDSLDPAFRDAHEVSELEIHFLGETHESNPIEVYNVLSPAIPPVQDFSVRSSGKEVSRARLVWRTLPA